MGHEQHTIAVLAPALYLTVTVESTSSGADEIHVHPGGQGFWIARMLKHLDERPLVCGPVGGETGKVFLGLLSQFGMDVSPIEVAGATSMIIQDRRTGERVPIAESPTAELARHEIDDVYGRFLDRALASSVCVVTGQPNPVLPVDFYKRLGNDLASAQVEVVADMHGAELAAFLEGGPIRLLKVSDEDLAKDGLLPDVDAGAGAVMKAFTNLTERGAETVVLSRQDRPALAIQDGQVFRVEGPALDPADHRGAGDSMTAGLAAGVRRATELGEMLRLAAAAGAANVTRHGLGSAVEGLLPGLMDRVTVNLVDGDDLS